ncbi:MAG TPA: YfiR family protein [Candidatus Saccharimonadia bacterium]|nr:YfiR family protein [Candidatus Saccharimonadia bacterium]
MRCAAVLAICAALAFAPPARAEAYERAQLVAAYIVNFMRYTEWPAPGPVTGAPLVVVVHRAPATAKALAAIAASGTRIGTHSLEVRRARTIEALQRELIGAHVLYAGADHEAALALAGGEVLTIGSSPEFAKQGGMLALVPEGGRVVFDANLPAIRAAGLSLSAKVLALARHVEGR